MCGAPSDVPVVGYGLCLPRFHACLSGGALSMPLLAQGCQAGGRIGVVRPGRIGGRCVGMDQSKSIRIAENESRFLPCSMLIVFAT